MADFRKLFFTDVWYLQFYGIIVRLRISLDFKYNYFLEVSCVKVACDIII